MDITIKINTDNAAFQDEEHLGGISRETARILRRLADQVEARGLLPEDRIIVGDLNGNTVGELTVA